MNNIVKSSDSSILGNPFELRPNALIVQGKPTEKDYEEAFRLLSLWDGASSWWWGDLALSRNDEKTLKEWAEKYDKNYGALRVCKHVADTYEVLNRFNTLGFRYHQIAAPEDDRLEWLARAVEEKWSTARLAREIRQSKIEQPPEARGLISLVKADALDFLKTIKDGTVDLLLTDPPYSTDIEDIAKFAKGWLPEALKKIRKTGRAYIFIGSYPVELEAYLNAALPTQVLAWEYRNTLGPAPKDRYKLNWQAILYFKMVDAPDLTCPLMTEQFTVQDINAPDGRLGDRFHAWQKPMEIAERFIKHSTKAGDLMIDPFAGTGTFLLAAANLGRQAKGCDNNDAIITIAKSRGC